MIYPMQSDKLFKKYTNMQLPELEQLYIQILWSWGFFLLYNRIAQNNIETMPDHFQKKHMVCSYFVLTQLLYNVSLLHNAAEAREVWWQDITIRSHKISSETNLTEEVVRGPDVRCAAYSGTCMWSSVLHPDLVNFPVRSHRHTLTS